MTSFLFSERAALSPGSLFLFNYHAIAGSQKIMGLASPKPKAKST